jgi:tetratricopeptide (TPR) repeat protein
MLTVDDVAVQSALDCSYNTLPPVAARLYRLLGVLPCAFFAAAVAAAAFAVPVGEAERLLDALVEVNLVEDVGPDRYRYHDLIRLHAQGCAESHESEQARADALRRVFDWYLHAATAAEEILTPSHRTLARTYVYVPDASMPFDDGPAALEWLDLHRPNLVAAVRIGAERGWHEGVWQLADAMWPLFLRLRHYDSWMEVHELGLAAARQAGDRAAEQRMLTSGEVGLRGTGRTEEAIAWSTQALRIAREDGDRRGMAQALNSLGQAHRQAGRLAEAEPYFAEALALREALGYIGAASDCPATALAMWHWPLAASTRRSSTLPRRTRTWPR